MGYLAVGAVLLVSTAWIVYRVCNTKVKSQGDNTRENRATPQEAGWQASVRKKEVGRTEMNGTTQRPTETGNEEASSTKTRRKSMETEIPSFALQEPTEEGQDKTSYDATNLTNTTTTSSRTPKPSPQTRTNAPTIAMPPPPIPSPKPPSNSTKPAISMPPPPVPVPRLNPPKFSSPPTTSSTANTNPSPNRLAAPTGPSLRPPASSASSLRVPPPRSSRVITLSPGHSPLDWASLTSSPRTSGAVLQGASFTHLSRSLHPRHARNTPLPLLRIPPSVLWLHSNRHRQHSLRRGAPRDVWTSYNGLVYNMTAYLAFHPGGEAELLRGAGRDSGKLFAETHPWVNFEGILGVCCIGVLVGEDDARAVRVEMAAGGMDAVVDADGRLVVVVRPDPDRSDGGGGNPLDDMD